MRLKEKDHDQHSSIQKYWNLFKVHATPESNTALL